MIAPFAAAAPAERSEAPTAPQPTAFVSAHPPAAKLSLSLRHEVEAAIARALDWLADRQADPGYWSDPKHPALTALPGSAFLRAPHARRGDVLQRAAQHLLSCVQTDGGIYIPVGSLPGGGLSTFNTAVAVTFLFRLDPAAHRGVILGARDFLAAAQYLGDDEHRGGFPPDPPQKAAPDLLTTYHALEAVRLTDDAFGPLPGASSIAWEDAADFVRRSQARTGDRWGGFAYRPADGDAPRTLPLRAYGSMTYAGLLALVYADVSPADPRALSAFQWAARHWSLDENPGMGSRGLYFFYYVISKALTAHNRNLVPLPDGSFLDWRRAIAERIVSLQRIDPAQGQGYWENESGEFWECDTVLTTAYSVLALELLL